MLLPPQLSKAVLPFFATLASLGGSLPTGHASQAASYDFIVVGGGTAGNVVATRLSQQLLHCSILVIEAGPWALDEDRINIPGFKGSTLGTKYDWNITSIPQPQLDGRIITQSRGKVVGGTSAINLLIYDRASEPEYQTWEDLGNPGWGWDTMVRVMDKSSNFTKPRSYTGTTNYGTSGPINAVVDRYRPAQQKGWISTFENLGIEHNTEWMGGENEGVAFHSSTIDPTKYTRSYSAVEYLPRAGSNVHVMPNTEVAKVNLEKKGGKFVATGVTLLDGDIIMAKNEVILSAGTIKSPQILELSGIGGDTLQTYGIERKIHLPGVGENLQDHPRIQLAFQLKDKYTSFDRLKIDPDYAAEQLALWRANEYSAYDFAAGAFSYQNWSSILGPDEDQLVNAAKRVVAKFENNIVDRTKLNFLTDPALSSSIVQAEFILSDGYTGSKGYPLANSTLYGKGFFTIIAGLMHELARGSVHINSSEPGVNPAYDPAFASNAYDLQGLVAMAKYIRKVANTAPLANTWVSEYEPGVEEVQTDEEWEEYVRENVNTFYHPVGTCAMLPRKEGGVVDPGLKVYGTRNLRVVDASVIPLLLSAHPQSGIYGIAERAAETVAGEWRRR
ncbi:uncharacterized protein LTR77_010529 [Saxophila tyrrhenica]|uniref:Glucose-methanol-choline oxidoreductase N-terminal domain-containing protein n=1 Tax=Saxophila tyrrhenica TaxID=1690608 RepID=A0AAV9NWS5_9PEZI|nr:hypothetical protein LTR77_010529 [Saxophila tyrrhenica]